MTAQELKYKLQVLRSLLGTGMMQPTRPDKALRSLAALRRWGPTSAAAYTGAAIRFPNGAAIVDDRGTLTFEEVHRRTNALARRLGSEGISQGDSVAIMCRNHRGFIEATVALAKLGASGLYLNTAFAGPQIADVVEREDAVALIYDEEFAALVDQGGSSRKRFIAWSEPGASQSEPRLDDLIATGDGSDLQAPSENGRVVILTSGTTRSPKGAARRRPRCSRRSRCERARRR